jgi:tetratricopeptide (TPR) repeat protein
MGARSGSSAKPTAGRSVPARSAGSAGNAGSAAGPVDSSASLATGSLYERYKDALRRAHVAALRERNEAAIDAYGEAAMIAPDRALPHASIGGIFVKMGRIDAAITAYERGLELAPRDEAALRGIAEALSRAGRRTDAAAALDRLAEVLDGAGRLADASDASRRALELAESRARRRQVEAIAARLRAESPGDEAGQRALDLALRVLDPSTSLPAPGGEVAAEPAGPEPAIEPEPVAEPIGLGIALGAAAEAALVAGDLAAAQEGLLAAARAHRRAGRLVAAVDACDLAISITPADPALHLLLAELYLDRGWRSQAADKLLLLGRLAELDGDAAVREQLCRLIATRLPDEPRVAEICA